MAGELPKIYEPQQVESEIYRMGSRTAALSPRVNPEQEEQEMKIISHKLNMDTACVELKFADGSMIAIDTIAVENAVTEYKLLDF